METARALPVIPAPRSLGRLMGNREAAFWSLQAIGWSGYFLSQFVSALFYPEKLSSPKMAGYFDVLVVAALSGFVLSSLLRLVWRRVRDRPPRVVVPTVLIVVWLAALTWRLFINGAYVAFMDEADMLSPWHRMFGGVLISTYLLLCWSALYFGIYYYELMLREREATLKATTLAQEAQMKMLRYQLNPHFLFNTLNSISTLVLLKQTERANAMLARLSSFLRYTLANESTAKVTLAQEVETLKLYLEIEKMRFEDRMRPHFRIDAETIGAKLPSLLLQPLIENAIKYAVTPSETGADIWISASREGGAVRIEVADNGEGGGSAEIAAHPSTGVGLVNIKERLAQAYGNAHTFMTRKNEHGGFSVILEIPYQSGDED